MNANPLLRTVLSVLGRNPLPDDFPELRVALQYETAELTFPALVVSCSLTRVSTLPHNFTASFELAFALIVPAADYSSDEHARLIEATDVLLFEKIKTSRLDEAALLAQEKCRIYTVDWAETSEQSADASGCYTLTRTFRGAVQL